MNSELDISLKRIVIDGFQLWPVTTAKYFCIYFIFIRDYDYDTFSAYDVRDLWVLHICTHTLYVRFESYHIASFFYWFRLSIMRKKPFLRERIKVKINLMEWINIEGPNHMGSFETNRTSIYTDDEMKLKNEFWDSWYTVSGRNPINNKIAQKGYFFADVSFTVTMLFRITK